MLAIKFKRVGKKHQPSYRVVVQPKRSKVLGKFIEDLGWYNPITKKLEVKKDRVEHWLRCGAQATDSVYNLLVRAEIIKGPKKPVRKIAKEAAVPPPA